MDILLITNKPPYPLSDATSTLIYYLAREFTIRHHQVDLACFFQNPYDVANIPRYEAFFRDVELVAYPNIGASDWRKRFKVPSQRFPSDASMAWSPSMWQVVQNWVRERRYSIVHFVGHIDVYEYAHLVKRLPSILQSPILLTKSLANRLTYTSDRAIFRRLKSELEAAQPLEAWIYEQFDGVGVSTLAQLEVVQRDNILVRALPMGVDSDYFVPTGHIPQPPNLLFVGDFAHPVVHEAAMILGQTIFPAVQRIIPDSQLMLVGPSPSGVLKSMASDAVHLVGGVPDLRPYIEGASVLVSPLRKSLGLQDTILKALAMKTAIIASSDSLDGLSLQNQHQVLVAQSEEDFVRQIVRLLRDPALAIKLQDAGRHYALHQHSWQQVAAEYEDFYEQVAYQHRRH